MRADSTGLSPTQSSSSNDVSPSVLRNCADDRREVDAEVAEHARERALEDCGRRRARRLRDQLLVQEPVARNVGVLVEGMQFGDGERLGLVRVDADDGDTTFARSGDSSTLSSSSRSSTRKNRRGAIWIWACWTSPQTGMWPGRVGGRRIVPGEDGPNLREVLEEAPGTQRFDMDGDVVLERLAAGDVIRGEAAHALVLPGRSAIERQVEPDVLGRALRADVAPVSGFLADVDDCLKPPEVAARTRCSRSPRRTCRR